ncbi:unnamed protein product [Plasmodium vivax]|uniref:(malaria parasite P. vivax) hypothetical protein n=1 Tax=Plasmodium vivax TaxID=5855 RepID=A0A8S4HF52_PLAVI|nr:unnamed protein product [Plasmodium vivax]CAI7720298.1 PIR protein [Plasmodium vivax]
MAAKELTRITFNDVPSYLFYEDLKKDASGNEYSDYYNDINNLTGKHSWIDDLFKKLSRNISMIHNKHNVKDEFGKKHCFDLNYWLYDQVYNNLQSSKNVGELRTIVPKVQEVWKNIVDNTFKNNDYKCYPDQKLFSNMNFLQEIKDLFDFFEDFDIMKKEIIAETLKSCFKYREYLRQRIPIYYTWRDSCRVDGSTCKRYIDNYMKYRPSGIILSLGWTIYFTYKNYPCYVEVHDIFAEAKELPLRDDNLYKDLMEKLSSLNSGHDLLSVRADDVDTGPTFVRIMWDIFYFVFETAMPMGLFLFGAFLLVYMIYKFTPFGRSLLRTRAKVRKKIRANLDYEDIVLLNGSNESLATSSDDSSYHLSYSSSIN